MIAAADASVPLEDYALLGDCHSAALVSRQGSIDWLCWPRFDSPACLCALLGNRDNGRWLLAPKSASVQVSRRYLDHTLILETRFETAEGSVTVTDFLLAGIKADQPLQLVRVARGERGVVPMHMELLLRFDYGSSIPWIRREGRRICAVAGPHAVQLFASIELSGDERSIDADFELRAGDEVSLTLTYQPSHVPEKPPVSAGTALRRCLRFWRDWSAMCSYQGEHEAAVRRSLLTLKALTYAPTGGIVAAPTTSLPERIGGERNWDYRFCWVRDAATTLYALLMSGYTREAEAWRNWLLRAVAGNPAQTQVLYGLSGERHNPELEISWLSGYAGSHPVRVGNAAARQLQLDTFGELMDATYQCRERGLHNDASWALEQRLLEHLETAWREPDCGIWEIRGTPRHFTHSKIMAWVAFDRAIRSVERFDLRGPVEHWRAIRARIHAEVCERGFSPARNAFTQSYESQELDASLLLLPLVGFLPADDERVRATVTAIERDLLVEETFVLRYRTRPELDGLTQGEGAFLPCSFWLVSVRVMYGRISEARELFERLLALRNDVGLLAEEFDPRARRMLGNFPQAFSHLALVDAAISLSHVEQNPADRRLSPASAAAETRS